jgi:hypothetical protein
LEVLSSLQFQLEAVLAKDAFRPLGRKAVFEQAKTFRLFDSLIEPLPSGSALKHTTIEGFDPGSE